MDLESTSVDDLAFRIKIARRQARSMTQDPAWPVRVESLVSEIEQGNAGRLIELLLQYARAERSGELEPGGLARERLPLPLCGELTIIANLALVSLGARAVDQMLQVLHSLPSSAPERLWLLLTLAATGDTRVVLLIRDLRASDIEEAVRSDYHLMDGLLAVSGYLDPVPCDAAREAEGHLTRLRYEVRRASGDPSTFDA